MDRSNVGPPAKRRKSEPSPSCSSASNDADTPPPEGASQDSATPEAPMPEYVHKNVPSGKFQCPKCDHVIYVPRRACQDFVDHVMKNDANCFRYTGFPTIKHLKDTFEWLEPAAKKLRLWSAKRAKRKNKNVSSRGPARKKLELFQEYLLTLIRIRRGYDVEHAAYLFQVSPGHVSAIFITWVNFLAKCLLPLLKWPSKEVNSGNLPNSFKDYPKTRVVIDCTEFFIEKPFRPNAQRSTWSNYKHANTFKLLVGIMPTGTITFLSKLYSGSISDVSIVEKSGLLDKLEKFDDVMADRGFNIRHLLLSRYCTLNIPAFSHGKSLSLGSLRKSRKIASVRIHVERAIRRMKTFKIVTGIIPLKLRFYLNQILVIIAFLCNLQERLC